MPLSSSCFHRAKSPRLIIHISCHWCNCITVLLSHVLFRIFIA